MPSSLGGLWQGRGEVDDAEFDVAWRLAFGGVTADMSARIDDPKDGFMWRGAQMDARSLTL